MYVANKRSINTRALVFGWTPPGHDDEETHVTNLLSDRVAPDDPAIPFIFRAIMDCISLELEFTDHLVDQCVRVGRKRHAAAEETRRRVRERAPLSVETLAAEVNSIIYYMRIGNRVKIGYTTNVRARLEAINPEELLAIEPGGFDLEQQRHEEYSFLRTHGEWFKLEEPLTSHIARIQGELLSESA